MKSRALTELRRRYRIEINRIVDGLVRTHVFALSREDILELRREIRASSLYPRDCGRWPMIVWRQETRLALGYPIARARRSRTRTLKLRASDIIPAMRQWYRDRGFEFQPEQWQEEGYAELSKAHEHQAMPPGPGDDEPDLRGCQTFSP